MLRYQSNQVYYIHVIHYFYIIEYHILISDQFLTSSVFAATVVDVSIRLEKLVRLPCLLLLLRQPTSATSPAAILAILSFSTHCDSGIPNTRPPATSASKREERKISEICTYVYFFENSILAITRDLHSIEENVIHQFLKILSITTIII